MERAPAVVITTEGQAMTDREATRPSNEGELLASLERGERWAAERLVEQTYQRVFASLVRLTGGDSDYVRPEHRAAIHALFPNARFVKIPGVGHWLHAEKPRAFADTVAAFLDA